MPEESQNSQSLTYSARVLQMIWVNLGAVRALFEDPKVDEIQINTPKNIYVRYAGEDKLTDCVLEPASFEAACTAIASINDKTIAPSVTSSQEEMAKKILSAKLPGVRIEVILQPVAVRGTAMMIRKHNPKLIPFSEYVAQEVMTACQANRLKEIAESGETFVISGPTYSGKTTLLNTMLNAIPSSKRFFIIEQVSELLIPEERNHTRIECDPDHGVTPEAALRTGMRFSPHWIISGELRGPEAMTFLDAANTGHPGATTLHANSHIDALGRLEDMCVLAGRNIPHDGIKAKIARSVKWVVHIQYMEGIGRKITGICKILGRTEDLKEYVYEDYTNR